MEMHAHDNDYLTVNEAAAMLRVAPATVRRWIRAGEVPAYHLGPRRIALRRADVARLVTPVRPSLDLAANDPRTMQTIANHVATEATPADQQREAEVMAVLDTTRQADAVRREQTEVRRLTDEEVRQGLEAMERLQEVSREIVARRGGKLFSPSWQIIDEMRDERIRELTGE